MNSAPHQLRTILLTGILSLVCLVRISAAPADTTRFDREVLGRPFTMDELFGDEITGDQDVTPEWVQLGEVENDTMYWGIGVSSLSQLDADDQARLAFAQMVEVNVSSIARQAFEENQDQLSETYSYETLVSTDLSLRGILITEQYESADSTFYSLIQYGKTSYHELVTQEIKVRLRSEIERSKALLTAQEALRADSLQHKITMDSLALAREQAILDSIQKELDMEAEAVRQAEEHMEIMKRKHADFLDLTPHHRGVDAPTAGLQDGYGEVMVRWNTMNQNFREIRLGGALSVIGIDLGLTMNEFELDKGEISGRVQVLPPRGELYRISLVLGWTGYIRDGRSLEWDLTDLSSYQENIDKLGANDDDLEEDVGSSFLAAGSFGIPQTNMHVSLYADKRRIAFTNVWYPFVRNLGDAISLVTQIEYHIDELYRNRFGDELEFQGGIRFTAIPGRFSTLIAYEDNEWWRLTFEIQI